MFKKLFKIKTDYKFKESKSTACFVCEHVMDGKRPILFVSHDKDDSNWQFLCGGNDHNDKSIRIISLEQITTIDNTVNDLYEMPEGVGAEREKIGMNWKPFKIAE